MSEIYSIHPGDNRTLGARLDANGVNFCIFSRHATRVELNLYDSINDDTPFQVIHLDPHKNRTFFFWHTYVEGLKAGCYYTWRVEGPGDTQNTGFRFNYNIELLDPWARAVVFNDWDRKLAVSRAERSEIASSIPSMRALVVNNDYDWEQDQPLNHPLADTIIYEMHIGGFTRHPSAAVDQPGTFAAVIEKIPYLKALGVTDVELMPIMAFDEQDVPENTFALGLSNYWGYSTHSFYSPHPRYCVSPDQAQHLNEFRDMVKALHRAGIGVILDVVFNHTAEGGETGPALNFKGLFNEMMYHLDAKDKRRYRDYTGCGNTVNCNHPLITRFILDCLIFWVTELHVDGFRFDLASVFSRGEDGEPMYNAPLPWSIEFSRSLTHSKIIAEAWDAAGLYQVGSFPGYRWSEWNGQYRDIMRKFVRGDKGMLGAVATCLAGSSDIYQSQGRLPINSINFISCHDGFTQYDLVGYNEKHNNANGENNLDGHNENFSWNCGVEGSTENIEIINLRKRQIKNFATLLLVSQGVPMILSGDEVLRTQSGNNNSYCQDNELSWFDWRLVEVNKDMLRFYQNMISFRKRHRCLRSKRFLTGTAATGNNLADISWHGTELNTPRWSDEDARFLAFTLAGVDADEEHVHILINMSGHHQRAKLPEVVGRHWYRAVDTNLSAPHDIAIPQHQSEIKRDYTVHPRSIVVLEAR